MEFLDYDMDELFRQAKEKAEAEGAYTHEAWREIVDGILQDRMEYGEIHDDDLEGIRSALVERFDEIENETPEA